jgi:uncharacterized alpha-E superfamily protein
MLGTTARRLFWMFRNLERTENTARLVEAGLHIALTRSEGAAQEWKSVVSTASSTQNFLNLHEQFSSEAVIDFLLREESNPLSVLSCVNVARENARGIRTALTRETWEATNECWMTLTDLLNAPIDPTELPNALRAIKRESAYVRGAMHGTMTRNDSFNFARLGTLIERADNTARILDVKYYLLLPSVSQVGSRLDTVQWETILRAVSARRAYRSHADGEINPAGIADFALFDEQMPRSLRFCIGKIAANLDYLNREYQLTTRSAELADEMVDRFESTTIEHVFDAGLHEFLQQAIIDANGIATQIQRDYHFDV